MYKLKFLPNSGMYQIHSKESGAFEGTLMAIKHQSIQMGVNTREFDLAIKEMKENRHNVAKFGLLGIFLFTKSS